MPFLASAVLILVGVHARSRLPESPEFQQVTETHAVPKFPLKDTLRSSRGTILTCLIIASLVDIAAVPLVAVVADRIGNRQMLICGAIYSTLAAFPFFWLIDTGAPGAVLVAMFLFATIGHATTYGAMAGFLAELFDAEHRYTGVSVACQVGGLITSSPAPFVAAALFAGFGASWAISLYIVLACVLTFTALLLAPRRR